MKSLSDEQAKKFRTRAENKMGRYDWDTILNGKAWLLKKDEDYFCGMESFRNRCYHYAYDRHIKCHAHWQKDDSGEFLLVQAYNPGD